MDHVVFRTDASLDIGSGHVMRCLTLADALMERGWPSTFVCRSHTGHLFDLIRARGHTLVELPAGTAPAGPPLATAPAHWRWLGADWQTDAEQTRRAIAGKEVRWLVVDHYALDAQWELAVRPSDANLLAIDDLADRRHACDLLLDQNLRRTASDYNALTPLGCKVLTGPRYALVRPEFANQRNASLARRDRPQLRRILITLGGVDKGNVTGAVLESLRRCKLPHGCSLVVVMGSQAPWAEQVRAAAKRMPVPTEVLVDVSDMATLMLECDLAIGAAGSTSWERCVLGLPSLLIVVADNQRSLAQALRAAGAAELADLENMDEGIRDYIACEGLPERMACMTRAMEKVCDGRGAERVAREVFGG